MSVFQKRRLVWLWAPGILAGAVVMVASAIRSAELTGGLWLGLSIFIIFSGAALSDWN